MANALRVGAASADPPFNGAKDEGGLVILLITIPVATESTVPIVSDRLLRPVSNQPGRH